ncbi:GmrSD restriction endonuclease domain-containing protein [Alkalicoccus luteus]|uniref:GmrSD restriction endonuclease domain-containing protein n=1 Tax=Alkalicoccus luteus TaxID=1237094 RepID=UPI00197B448F|nr:DUF262 domain-containing protein [Alkalicoccus luteus]
MYLLKLPSILQSSKKYKINLEGAGDLSNYQVNNTSVNILLNWIEEGIVAIPEIQRPFVWKATKVRDLLDSLYNDYPVGYIITWQNPDA